MTHTPQHYLRLAQLDIENLEAFAAAKPMPHDVHTEMDPLSRAFYTIQKAELEGADEGELEQLKQRYLEAKDPALERCGHVFPKKSIDAAVDKMHGVFFKVGTKYNPFYRLASTVLKAEVPPPEPSQKRKPSQSS